MKPHRIRMVHSLLVNYGIYKDLQVYRPPRATAEDMMQFHSDDYVSFLRRVSPDLPARGPNAISELISAVGGGTSSSNSSSQNAYNKILHKFNVGEDCPIVDGLFEYCQISAGGSIAGATKLNNGLADIAVNWAGGLHHAKRGEASGFCYINDIVLAILELLKYHQRVLYIDIDVHHGDGVEEAFYTSDRVMTVSFHKYGEFFPGTGAIGDTGFGPGRGYSINVPLRDGIDDESYSSVFEPIIGRVMEWYRPGAIILQCGADSLAGDRLGCFNLSHRGHAHCLDFVKRFNVPLLVLGGGGYTIRNVARCWAWETAMAASGSCNGGGVDNNNNNNGHYLPEEIPYNDYFEYYGPDYSINVPPNNMTNLNTKDYLGRVVERVTESLRGSIFAPGQQMHHAPKDLFGDISGRRSSSLKNGNGGGADSDEDGGGADDGGDDVLFAFGTGNGNSSSSSGSSSSSSSSGSSSSGSSSSSSGSGSGGGSEDEDSDQVGPSRGLGNGRRQSRRTINRRTHQTNAASSAQKKKSKAEEKLVDEFEEFFALESLHRRRAASLAKAEESIRIMTENSSRQKKDISAKFEDLEIIGNVDVATTETATDVAAAADISNVFTETAADLSIGSKESKTEESKTEESKQLSEDRTNAEESQNPA